MEERVATQHVAVVRKDADGDFCVHFPDLPGCFTKGATRDQACRFAAETLAFHLERLAAGHSTAPVTRSLEAIQAEYQDGMVILVEAAAFAS